MNEADKVPITGIPANPSRDLQYIQIDDRIRLQVPFLGIEMRGKVIGASSKHVTINWDDGNWGKFHRSNKVIWNLELDRE
jgi:hypothetical protein